MDAILQRKRRSQLFPICLPEGKSCLDASLSLQEAVLYNTERGSKVYCCFIDSCKAFDTIWMDGLLCKLYNLGNHGKTWRLLRNWYSTLTNRVIYDGIASSEFPIRQGVRQGGVLSPWLFMVFNDDLPKLFQTCNEGLRLGTIPCNPIMVADDITLLSTRAKGLQKMLNLLEVYSLKWRFDFSPSKTAIVIFGESTQMLNRLKNSRAWTLCDQPIDQKHSWPHVAITLSGNFSSSERTEEA